MTVLNQEILTKASRRFPQARHWLQGWLAVASTAGWKHLQDVRRDFPHADGVRAVSGLVVTGFNVGGNDFRLLTTIAYATQRIIVHNVLTHSQYSKNVWRKRL